MCTTLATPLTVMQPAASHARLLDVICLHVFASSQHPWLNSLASVDLVRLRSVALLRHINIFFFTMLLIFFILKLC